MPTDTSTLSRLFAARRAAVLLLLIAAKRRQAQAATQLLPPESASTVKPKVASAPSTVEPQPCPATVDCKPRIGLDQPRLLSSGREWALPSRMYHASLGRFLQRDPAGYVDGLNLYAYVNNNPFRFTDPFGLTARTLGSLLPDNRNFSQRLRDNVNDFFTVDPQLDPFASVDDSLGRRLFNRLVKPVAVGAGGFAGSAFQLVRHPIQTAQGLGRGIHTIATDLPGVVQGAKQAFNEFQDLPSIERGDRLLEFATEGAGAIVAGSLATKFLQRAKRLGQAASLIDNAPTRGPPRNFGPGAASVNDPVFTALSATATGRANAWNMFQKATRGQFSSRAEAAAAYRSLISQQSPWPAGFRPQQKLLKPGTRFEMAVGSGQPANRPGAFGTFDGIPDVAFVRQNLAVKQAWKPDIDRVVTFEVTTELPINLGPVGPQIDQMAKRFLPGGASQLEMLVPGPARMNHLRVIAERRIR